MDDQTSRPPKPLLDFVHGAHFQQLVVNTKAFNQNQTHSLKASWQHHGCSIDDEIYDEVEDMFPYHGHPLSWYEFAESIYPENHDTAVTAMDKIDLELKQPGQIGSNDGVQQEAKICGTGKG